MSDLVVSDLTPMGMYHNADAVVQAILLILVAASVVSWTVLFAKGVELAAQRVRLGRALMRLRAASGLDALAGLGGAAARMLAEARLEIEASGATLPAAGVKERLALRIARIEAGEGRRAQRGTGVLATIGAVAPFVGLFGTVWGIMNSFVSIAQSQTTNLAVVAPGIAEALMATGLGLLAAIPATIFYNKLSDDSDTIASGYEQFADEFGTLLSRNLDA